jgi:hypothetical protein
VVDFREFRKEGKWAVAMDSFQKKEKRKRVQPQALGKEAD